jgi:hypothetical protein
MRLRKSFVRQPRERNVRDSRCVDPDGDGSVIGAPNRWVETDTEVAGRWVTAHTEVPPRIRNTARTGVLKVPGNLEIPLRSSAFPDDSNPAGLLH